MMTDTRTKLAARLARTLVAVAALLAASSPAQAQGEPKPKNQPKLPEGLTEVTKEHLLTKAPNFFYFDYPGPGSGRRLWLRVDDQHFVERYPDGFETRFKILGLATVANRSGTIVVKLGSNHPKGRTPSTKDGEFQVFIPDKGNKDMAWLYRHNSENPWREQLDKDSKAVVIQSVQ